MCALRYCILRSYIGIWYSFVENAVTMANICSSVTLWFFCTKVYAESIVFFFFPSIAWYNMTHLSPYLQAVCCSDHLHCCPNGYTCDVPNLKCIPKADVPMMTKLPALAYDVSSPNIVCPDGKSSCADGQPCCLLASGQYACCPQPNVS